MRRTLKRIRRRSEALQAKNQQLKKRRSLPMTRPAKAVTANQKRNIRPRKQPNQLKPVSCPLRRRRAPSPIQMRTGARRREVPNRAPKEEEEDTPRLSNCLQNWLLLWELTRWLDMKSSKRFGLLSKKRTCTTLKTNSLRFATMP
ncbi:hypothetical protein D910_05175 [Dendroctonus ponderosae]|uniref:Uncharacterized protein n=1 Tax=Dendroctonus ponderosae TaxID=77166 RepID=U4UB05_DENPD|nr:hypothetical protein D910_05175 [Dendroctonus ponderosae]